MRAISVPGIIASILCIQLLISSISTQSLGGPIGVFGQEVCDPNSATISRDSSGPVVQALQTILTQLQFDPGPIDGIFGNTTENAVMLFQQANGLDVDGVVGPNTWSKLCEAVTSVASPLNQPVTTEESQTSQPSETLIPTTECDPNSATISRDSSGPVVQALQTILTQLQFDPGPIDGIFGNTTENAVMLFQQANGLDVDGVVGPNTWSKLCEAVTSVITGVQSTNQTGGQLNENPNESSQQQLTDGAVQDFPPLNFPPLQPLQPAGNEGPQSSTVAQGTECDPNEKTISKLKQSNGPVVVRLQNLLFERGFDPGPIDGVFGDKTEAAVKAFQEASGLEVDGVVGPKTWLALCESSPVISQPTFPTPPVIPIAEICGDGIDNNLDGITDENCVPETPVGPQQCLPGEEPGTTTLSLTSAGCVTSAPELPAPCSSTQHSSSLQFFQHNTSPWKFDFGVVDGRGLVLQDITAGIKHLQSWSAPQFRIATTDGKNRLVTFCGASDTQRPLVESDEASFHRISWGFDKTMDNGVLSVEYNVLVSTKPFFPNSCETFSGNDCFKILPLVKYTWTSPSTHIAQLEAFIKLDYGDQRGVAVFQDANSIPTTIITGSFAHASMLLKEGKFRAVTTSNGKTTGGSVDSIHTARIGEEVFVPGCRDNPRLGCLHMHWRWGSNLIPIFPGPNTDPLVDPITQIRLPESQRGTPYFVKGQTIDLVFLKLNPQEDVPADPRLLVNGEALATASFPKGGSRPINIGVNPNAHLDTADHPILWYLARFDENAGDVSQGAIDKGQFFEHGFYLVDSLARPRP